MELCPILTDAAEAPGEWARRREAEGWDLLGVADHVAMSGRGWPHVWVACAAALAATARVPVTTTFANGLLRSPVDAAHAALALDQMAPGRFQLGLGAGWQASEITAMGLTYPEPAERARRLHEAVLVVRDLLRTGSAAFDGDHASVHVDGLGPRPAAAAPLLVASLGGPWTIRTIAPLVDRVELKGSSPGTRGGALDLTAAASVGWDHVRDLVRRVREVAPDVPLGFFAMAAAGDDPAVAPVAEALGDGLYGRFCGEPARVMDHLRALGDLGIGRVSITELAPGTLDALAGHLSP